MLKDLCFAVIHTCPNNCKFCSSNSSIGATKIISLDDFKRTVNHFMENGGIEEISISGGEPFLHPQLIELCKIAREIFPDILLNILTNGIILSDNYPEEKINELKSLNVLTSISQYPA